MGKGEDERKSRVVRHKRNSFGDTGTSSPFLPLLASPSSPLVSIPLDPSNSEIPCFFTGLWDFFHAGRRVVHQRGLTASLLFSLFLRYARTLVCVPARERKNREKEKRQGTKQ